MHWISTASTDWTVPGNWSANRIPIYSDEVYFDIAGTASSTNAGANLASVKGLHILGAYNQTLTMANSLVIGTLEMSPGYGGKIDQPAPANDLWVTTALNWTSGTINSTTNLANLTIMGATALIAPANAGTVNLGSNVLLRNGASAAVKDGIVNIANDAGIEIDDNCTFTVAVGSKGVKFEKVDENGVSGRLLIKVGGSIEVFRVDPNDGLSDDWESKLPIDNAGGKLWIHGKVATKISGRAGGLNGGSVIQAGNGSLMVIEAGSTLEVQRGVVLNKGKLSITSVGEGVQAEAKIDGDFTFNGGFIEIAGFGTLRVEGDVTWTGGVYRPHVRVEINRNHKEDLWYADSFAIKMGADAALLGPAPPENPGNYDLTNVKWAVIKAAAISLTPKDRDERSLNFELPGQAIDWSNDWSPFPDGNETGHRINLRRERP